mgnify:FL=1|jgi:hypothetical protein
MAAAMPTSLETLQAQVLGLSKADRARLLDRLVESLDAETDVDREWDRIAEARDAELATGSVEPVLLDDAMKRLKSQFPG